MTKGVGEIKEERKVTNEDRTETLVESALRSSLHTGMLVEIYRDNVTPRPIVGVVLEFSRTVAVMAPIGDDLEFDGMSVIRTPDITRIKSGDRELQNLSVLERPELSRLDEIGLLDITAAGTVMTNRLGPLVVHLEADDSAYLGWFREVDDAFVRLECLGTVRTADRYHVILASERISRLEAQSRYARATASLLRSSQPSPSQLRTSD